MCKRILALVVAMVMIFEIMPIGANATTHVESKEVFVEEQTAETENADSNVEVVEFEGREYTIPSISWNREPGVSESGYVEEVTEMPHYIQQYYRNTKYGHYGNVATHGCGVTSLAMVLTYLLDQEILPDYLAEKYGKYNTKVGSSYTLFSASAEDYEVDVEQVWNWEDVETALENGQVVIANARKKSIFTDSGHYIVLYGMTEEGKILIKDPNIYNYGKWSSPILKEGFEKGFEPKSVKYHCFPMWIYALKDLEAIAAQD